MSAPIQIFAHLHPCPEESSSLCSCVMVLVETIHPKESA